MNDRTPIWEVEADVYADVNQGDGPYRVGFRTVVRVFMDGAHEVSIKPAPGADTRPLDASSDEWETVIRFAEALLHLEHIVVCRPINGRRRNA